ncbi:MAG: class I SAM-dependent methyltransferase [Bradymonadaceae bacterium]|nr:class I SAM-dependent methyltransferase [Lujinxingiaceae bacterium]
MERKAHWEGVYTEKSPSDVSWFQPRPALSLELIEACSLGRAEAIIDIGGGASLLVDHLLDRGHGQVSVLDISAAGLAASRQRLGERAPSVCWLEADITDVALAPQRLWHDRAVFHFLTDPVDRQKYVQTLLATLESGGHAVIATFAEDGPERCSGLPIVRYSPESLAQTLGKELELVKVRREAHQTPAGRAQSFVYCLFRRS